MNHMDKNRVDERIPISLQGYLVIRNTFHAVSTKNISEHGLGFSFISMQSPVIFDSESNLEIILQISPEENITLSGKKRWFTPYKEIGIEITNQSLKYKEFVDTQIQKFGSSDKFVGK